MIAATDKVSIATLEDTPRRAGEFIRGIGLSSMVMKALEGAGYTRKDHEEGIRLLIVVLGYIARRAAVPPRSEPSYVAAEKEIKRWVKADFRRIKVGLHRFFPEQAEYLFSGLDLSGVIDAVAVAELFLERLGSLANGTDRKATRKADHAALAMLETRRVTKANLKHLQALVAETHATPAVPPVDVSTGESDGRLEALVALRAWYADWAETARVVLTRRDHLIRVGLATRKPRASAAPPPVVVAPVAPSSPPPAPEAPAMLALPMTTSTRAA